eukprot:511478-Pyramimonas_sp.AAC.1
MAPPTRTPCRPPAAQTQGRQGEQHLLRGSARSQSTPLPGSFAALAAAGGGCPAAASAGQAAPASTAAPTASCSTGSDGA